MNPGLRTGMAAAALLAGAAAWGAQLDGTVRIGASGKPVSGALVRITPAGGTPSGASYRVSETGLDGRYTVGDVAAGAYILEVLVNNQLAYRGAVSVDSAPAVTKDMALEVASPRETLQATILEADDDVRVVRNGESVLQWSANGRTPVNLPLRAGDTLEVIVFNKGSFTGGLEAFGGHKPEGWKYTVMLQLPDSSPVYLSGHEHRPPPERHGQTFSACRVEVRQDPKAGWALTAAPTPWCAMKSSPRRPG
jgi:hypothetical protein